jgi:hypothetical protein
MNFARRRGISLRFPRHRDLRRHLHHKLQREARAAHTENIATAQSCIPAQPILECGGHAAAFPQPPAPGAALLAQ